MITELAERRRAGLLRLYIVAAALIAIAAVTTGIEMRATSAGAVSGPVLPGVGAALASAQRIEVASAEANYRIERTERDVSSITVGRPSRSTRRSAASSTRVPRASRRLRSRSAIAALRSDL